MALLPRNEKSFWREFYPGQIYPMLADDMALAGGMTVDVVVIGAGITGLTAAYLLKQRGLKVAVIEKDTVGGGTSGRTTGKITSQHGITYADLLDRLGDKTARTYGQANQAAIEQVDQIIQKERIDCDWQRDDNYVFTADPEKVSMFQQEAKIASELGLPATFETETPLPFEVRGAVKFAGQAKINSQKYLSALAKAINGDDSYVFEQSNVTNIRDGAPCQVSVGTVTVVSKYIIVATNVPTFPLLARGGYCIMEYPTESFILAGRGGQPLEGMYISPDKQHYSILPVTVGDEQIMLFAGEGGNLPGFRLGKRERHERLAAYAQKHFGVTDITNRWSDRDYLSYDDIPLVGKLYPWSKNLYVGTAYRKWGLSNGTAAGMMLSDLITNQPNPWTPHFASNRRSAITSFPRAVSRHLNNSG